jgi:TP901 family phage tail tape measure protein
MATDLYTVTLQAESKGVVETKREIDDLGKKTGLATKAIGLFGAAFASIGLASTFKKITQDTMAFTKSISELSAITGATGKDLEFYEQQAALIGKTTTLSASQAATAFKLIASAKPDLLQNAEALAGVTKEAVRLAEAAGVNLADAASTVGVSLNQFGAEASEAARFVNVLAAGAKEGSSSIEDTSMAMKNAGVAAKLAGLSFEEANVGVQLLAKGGLFAAEAGTGFRQVLLKLENEAEDRFKPSMVGLAGALENLAAENMNLTELTDLFGAEAMKSAAIMIAGAGDARTLERALTGTSTATEMAATNFNNLDGDVLSLNSANEGLAITLGKMLEPAMRATIQSVTDFSRQADDFVNSDKFVEYLGIATTALKLITAVITTQLIISIYASITAFAAGATAAGLFGTALTLMGGPIGVAVVGLVALYEILQKVVGTNADNLTKELQLAASEGIAPLNQHIHELTARQESLKKSIDDTSESAKYSSAAANQLSKSKAELDAVTNSLTEAEELLKEQLTQNAKASNTSTEAADSLTSQFDELQRGITNGLDPAIETNSFLVENHTEKFADLKREIDSQTTAIGMTARELELYSAQSKLGAKATLEEKIEVERMVGALYDAEQQYKQTTLENLANTKAAEDSALKHKALTDSLSLQMTQLGMTERELFAYNQQSKLGATATLEQRLEIESQSLALYDAKEAHKESAEATKEHTAAQQIHKNMIENVQRSFGDLIYKTLDDGKLNFKSFFGSVVDGFKKMVAELVAQKIMNAIFGDGGIDGFLSGLSGGFSSIISGISKGLGGLVSSFVSSISGLASGAVSAASGLASGVVSAITGGGSAAVTAASGGVGATAGGAAAGTTAGLTAGGVIASAGSFIAGMFGQGAGIAAGTMGPPTAAALAGSNLGAMLFNPVTAAIAAIYAAYKLDSGGTPTSAAGITMAVTAGMNQHGQNTFAVDAFESGFAPIGFKQNATDAQAAAAVKPIRDLDSLLTQISRAAGYDVNLANHTFSGLGVEGSGSGTLLGTFIEEGKVKGVSIDKQMDTYAAEWVRAVGARNGIAANVISEIVGSGTAEGILQAMGEVLKEHKENTLKSELVRINEESSSGTKITETANQEAVDTVFNAADVTTLYLNKAAKKAAEETKLTISPTGLSTDAIAASNMGPKSPTELAVATGPSITQESMIIGKTGLTEEGLKSLSDLEVGKLIEGGKFSLFQAANFYQDRYPGLTIANVKESMTAMGLTIPSHRSGLDRVPYDGYIAELHAGERVQTAAQVEATDRMSSEMVGLRNNLNELMIVVAKAVTKTARIEDRWDKNGLPPVRA